MMIDYICLIDKVTAKSITVEVANTERPFNVEWKDSLIMSVKIRWTGTAYDFCNYVIDHGHKVDVIKDADNTFENLIMTEAIIIPDNQGCWCKDELELKFTPARENENTNKNKEDTTMLKLYLCTPETYTLDEYNGFVVLAENKSEAFKIVTDKSSDCFAHQCYISIEEVDMNKKGIVLGSFNAG